jgi:hypothetical protein
MKVRALVNSFTGDPTVLLLDNFEDTVSSDSRSIRDTELATCLQSIVGAGFHSLKVIITTRITPVDFAEVPPAQHVVISLDEGLESPFAERVLKELDSDGHVGLRDASDATLARVKACTRGFPRALEAFYSILAADRDASIDDILSWSNSNRIIRVLVGEAFSRLSEQDQRVMQALAVYGYPSSPTAVDYLLQPWFPIIDSAVSLKRLVNMRMVRKEGAAYYLHPVDREYALSRLEPRTAVAEFQGTPLSNESLLDRAANYYEALRRPEGEWKTLDDLDPHIREFSLRLEGRQDDAAAAILSAIHTFLDKHGAFQQLNGMALALRNCAATDDARLVALNGIVTAAWRQGRTKDAVTAQEELLRLEEKKNNPDDIVVAKINLLSFKADLGLGIAR